MAINEENASGNQRAAAAPAAGQGWSFHGGMPLLQAPIPRSSSSDYFNKLKAGLQEIYKQADSGVKIDVIELSQANDSALNFSSLIVATTLTADPRLGTAYHILLAAATGDELQPRVEQMSDRTVNVKLVPGDAINDILIQKASRLVASKYNIPLEKTLFVDGTVLTTRFNPDDKQQLHDIALSAALAGVTELSTLVPGFEDINLAKLVKQGQSTIEIAFQRQQLPDPAGNVIRSDQTITFTDRKGDGQRDRQLNTGDKVAKISELGCFVDAVWYPLQDPNTFGGFAPMGNVPTQKFAARVVITNMECAVAQTPATVLLSLSTALALRNPQIWYQSFRPVQTGRKEIDMTDVGALNIEGNIPVPVPGGAGYAPDPSGFGRPIDTKDDSFRTEQLGLLLSTLFHKEPMFAIDIQEYGPQTHYLSVFAEAARQEGHAARERIFNAANILTNGEFERHFPKNGQIFATQSERIHAGTWVDYMGNTRDLRDFDYLAVANLLGQRHPQILKDFSDTFLRTDWHEWIRLEQRQRIIQQLSNDTAKFTGFFQRLTFSADFLRALDNAISTHNLRVMIRTPSSGHDFIAQRGIATYAQQALLGPGPSFIQNGGFTSGPAAMPGSNWHRF